MFTPEDAPVVIPEPGFYYHNKRTDDAPVNQFAYELIAVGYHTETGEHTALYRPLYEEAFSYQNGKLVYTRPLEMFMDTVERDGKQIPRFTKITEAEVLAALMLVRDEMYPNIS